MVIGVVPDISKTETLLNNLTEADFKLADVSVIMSDVKTRNQIASDSGPFKGTGVSDLADKLAAAGLGQADVDLYRAAVAQGSVLVAIAAPTAASSAAAEMLQDASARLVKILDGGERDKHKGQNRPRKV